MKALMHRLANALFTIIKKAVWLCYPKMQVIGAEQIPNEAVILVGNHAQMNGPIVSELYLPNAPYAWCAAQMMSLREVPSYAYRDFWSRKPRWSRPFYKLLSYLIAPVSILIFRHARTIPVYRDHRTLVTFRETIKTLQSGNSIVIFPEHDVPHNHVVAAFQSHFVDVAKLYHKRTGRELVFVPFYIAPSLRQIHVGNPIRFSASAPLEQERERICRHLIDTITETAVSLPKHRITPYRNIPKRHYPVNR